MDRFSAFGLLILRAGIGAMIAFHGYPKFMGGVETWEKVGQAMTFIGMDYVPVFWGFCAAVIEFFGGIALILGLFTRLSSFLLCLVMAVATTMHFSIGDGMAKADHPIEMGIVFLALFIMGPGRYSIDRKLG
ncbi:MAG: DoxX family protein [Opitutaceae bacterium]|nr:DoxX family protein [Opitutaceae bacterium]